LKTKILYLQLFLLSFGISYSFSQSVSINTTVYYSAIDSALREKVQQYGADQVLVVFDIDNTILTSDTDLGSDIWYNWQKGVEGPKLKEGQKIEDDCFKNEAIGLLYELGTMSPTDTLLPGYIKSWQELGITIFALTSRSPDYRAATERELNRNDIHLDRTQLRTSEGKKLILSDTIFGRKMSYINGIMMTTGMNKGLMLDYLLDTTGMSFRSVIFVDDTERHINAVSEKASEYHTTDLVLFNYTKILTERKKNNHDEVLTQEQADKMASDWEELIRMLNTLFPERMEKSECVIGRK